MEVKRVSLKIEKTLCINLLFLWSFYETPYFTQFTLWNNICDVFMFVGYGYMIMDLSKNGSFKIEKNIMLILLFCFSLVISTIWNSSQLKQFLLVIRYILPVLAFCVYFNGISEEKKNTFLKALCIIHAILIVANFATVLIFPDGLYAGSKAAYETYYLLGHNNSAVRILLPGIAFNMIYDQRKYNKFTIRTYLLTIISMATVTITWSNTAMIGIGIVMLFLLLPKKECMPAWMNAKNFFMISVVLFVLIVIVRKLDFMQYIVVDLFKKDLTFSNRTVIWDAVILSFLKKPLLGYGYGKNIWEYAVLGRLEPSSAHNYFLDLLFRGGLIHFALQMLIVWKTCINLTQKNKNQIAKALSFVFLGYFIMWQFEAFINTGYIDMIFLCMLACDNEYLYSNSQSVTERK